MTSPQPEVQPPPYPRRFSWPMRLFLTLFLAAITYRCFGILLPMKEWKNKYEMRTYPTRLSSLPELAKKARKAGPNDPNPIVEDYMISADSIWDYWKPWPSKETRPQIKSWADGAKVTACWFDGRLAFLEHLAGIDEGWPMFSPKLSNVNYHTRARLLYEDDTELVVRQAVEPEDYRHYTHWMMDRVSNYETGADEGDEERCFGYCNLLRHRYEHNAAGAQLVTIVLFQVKVYYPEPGVDPCRPLREPDGPDRIAAAITQLVPLRPRAVVAPGAAGFLRV